jgi:hypothetical protein
MKVLYVVLACDAYYPTRCQWQKETWLSRVEHHVFLGCRMQPEKNMVGWGTTDDYHSCPLKYIEFMRKGSFTDYDWVVFVDDDTFVFPDRLESYLSTLDSTSSLYVGAPCNDGWTYMSGGAGFAVSHPLMARLRDYAQTTDLVSLHVAHYSDKTFGHWVHAVGGTEFVPNSRFHGDYRIEYAVDCFSCHYVPEQGFRDLMRMTSSTDTGAPESPPRGPDAQTES